MAIALLMVAAVVFGDPGEKEGKKRKKLVMSSDDLHVAFVPGREELVAAGLGGRAFLLSYPEIELVREFRGASERKVVRMRLSEDGRWLAARYKKGGLRVWEVTSGEAKLTLPDGESFGFHPAEGILVAFEPRVGVTRWRLPEGTRMGPPIVAAQSVEAMEISPDGRYLLTSGSCRVDLWSFRLCAFDLADGSVVAWFGANDDPGTQGGWEEFLEALATTGLEPVDQPAYPGCRQLHQGRMFCHRTNSIALVDRLARPFPDERSPGWHELPGRYLWEIRAATKGMRFFNSSDLSGDRRWVVAGVESSRVLLFDTEELEGQSMRFLGLEAGSWEQPMLVDSFELP